MGQQLYFGRPRPLVRHLEAQDAPRCGLSQSAPLATERVLHHILAQPTTDWDGGGGAISCVPGKISKCEWATTWRDAPTCRHAKLF